MELDRWAVVVTGGGALSDLAADAVLQIPERLAVVAADSGLDHAVAAGIEPTQLVGDLDSLSAAGRMWAYAHGLEIDEHPADKDSTDTELALAAAAAHGADDAGLLVVGGIGERLDHLLGVLLALGGDAARRFGAVRALIGATEFRLVHAGRSVVLPLGAGTTFSVMALHGPCDGVRLRGAQWAIDGGLSPTEARGLSNVAEGTVELSVASGTVTVAVPA